MPVQPACLSITVDFFPGIPPNINTLNLSFFSGIEWSLNSMKTSSLLFVFFFIAVGSLRAQDTPFEFMEQLPRIFTNVCTANTSEVQAYGEQLGAFSKKLQMKLDSLGKLKVKVQSGMKINTNSDTSELERQLQKITKMISDEDFSVEFDAALHTDAEKTMQQQLEENSQKQSTTSDYREMERLLAEIITIRGRYCQASRSRYIELLMKQRATLETDITSMVAAADLSQKIHCMKFGCTYFPELSHENALIHIVDHLKYMTILLNFFPGNE
jgi:hypothetical protein